MGAADGSSRRRHLYREEDRTLEVANAVGTYTARAFTMLPSTDLGYVQAFVFLATAHFMDMSKATNGKLIAYPDDVAQLTGFTESRCAGYLREIARTTGLLSGSAAAGYTLAGRMVD